MKRMWLALYCFLVLSFWGCQTELVDSPRGEVGYLSLGVGTTASVNTKAGNNEVYNGKQIAVKIINTTTGQVVKETNNWEDWKGEKISLSPNSYTIQAFSAKFDGQSSAYNKPFYAGTSDTFKITQGTLINKDIVCTLANVKVTVDFDQSFFTYFENASVLVGDTLKQLTPLCFEMAANKDTAYFPVTGLYTKIAVTNKSNKKDFFQFDTIRNVQARDHYKLKYAIADNGHSGITVEMDPTIRTYTYTFRIRTTPTTEINVAEANAWSNFAYVTGEIKPAAEGEVVENSLMKFEYKSSIEDEWHSVPSVSAGKNSYKVTLTGLTPATSYSYRLVYNGNEKTESSAKVFTTETQNKIPNLSFDDWVKDGKHYYAATSVGSKFWDSGNEGANTLGEKNPTRPEETDVKAGKAAKLASTTAAGQFAAGSLFTGDFGNATLSPLGAKLNFGQLYDERPSQMIGWYKYNPGSITHTKKDFIVKGVKDSCSIYIALTDWTAPFAVSTGDNKFVDFSDSHIIAYGELTKTEMCPATAMTNYEKFTIDLKYRNLERKPKYILIVCSSSKYGDYFTGSTSSVLLLDEFDFIFGEPIIDEAYIK